MKKGIVNNDRFKVSKIVIIVTFFFVFNSHLQTMLPMFSRL